MPRMTFRSFLRLLPVFAAAVLASCATKPQGFTKVKIYRLDPDARITAVDPSIPFEQQYLLHGAVTTEERSARKGNYYTFFWKVDDRSQPVKLRFEYRQSATRSAVKKQEIDISDVQRSNVTKLQITGEDFLTSGKVLAWRAVLLQGGKEIASTQSFMWH
jgi:outer membrane biogenesis lipoprotein LolB